MQVTDAMVQRAEAAIEELFSFCGFPNTRLPGTESVDCSEAARVALEAAFAPDGHPETSHPEE